MTRIPREFHFVFGLRPQTEPFHLVHYLCLASCLAVNELEAVHFHCHHEPHGPWWDRIRRRLILHRIEPDRWVADHDAYLDHDEGRFIRGWGLDYAHQSDFIRLRILLERGGVYADMDTLFVRPLPDPLYEESFVLGEERVVWEPAPDRPARSLCNALILSEPGAPFARLWLDRMREAFDGRWSTHSCEEAARLQECRPDLVHVRDERAHYPFPCTPEGVAALLEGPAAGPSGDLAGVDSIHLWAHVWWSPLRTDFTRFHAGLLTEAYVREVDTPYTVAARRFLDGAR